MKYKGNQDYFETAYRTGSDSWTHLSKKTQLEKLVSRIKEGSIILDVGSGRGLYAKYLAQLGHSVLGLDSEKNIVNKINLEIKNWELAGKLKFVEGSVLDIPFTDNSFDGIYDISLLEYLYKEDWEEYAKEITRVLKKGGFYLNISISKDTTKFLDMNPKDSVDGDVHKYGIHYHFFTQDEIKNIFKDKLILEEQTIEDISSEEDTLYIVSLFKK